MISDKPAQSQESYEQFFGFSAPPFSLSAKPRFRFPSAAHEDALLQVMYALERREPVIVVTGDIGLGKTLLCRTVLERLPRKIFLSVIDDPLLGRDDLLRRMLEDFGLVSAEHAGAAHASRHELAHTMNSFLSSLAPLEAHAVVIIDEAQHVQPDVVEQIRLLANTSDGGGTLLQIVLVGQPSLQELLARPELQQLRQRVTRYVRLTALTDAEVNQYIVHRLSVAREPETNSLIPGTDDLAREVARWNGSRHPVTFSDEAIQAIARMSHGIPRLVNVLCDRALEGAFAERSRTVDAARVESAARLLHLDDALGGFGHAVPHGAGGEVAQEPAHEPAHEPAGEPASAAEPVANESESRFSTQDAVRSRRGGAFPCDGGWLVRSTDASPRRRRRAPHHGRARAATADIDRRRSRRAAGGSCSAAVADGCFRDRGCVVSHGGEGERGRHGAHRPRTAGSHASP